MSDPSETEIAWLAGLLEGEGYFGVNIERRVSRPNSRDSATVELKMTDEDVVKRALAVMQGIRPGVNTVKECAPKPDSTHKVAYRCRVSSERAVAVMNAVLPYMGERRSAKIEGILARTNLSHSPSDRKTKVAV